MRSLVRATLDIARQVLGGVVAVAGMLEVDGPGFAEDRRIEPGEQVRALETVGGRPHLPGG
jgi:hypothetical protein